MSTSSQLIQRIENAVYHEPYMIPILFRDAKVKAGFLHSRLRRYVPHRVGIEFECFGDFANQYLKANNLKWNKFENFESQFHLTDFSQDTKLFCSKGLQKSQKPSIDNHEEIRVSIRDYRQLNGLYSIMKEMAKYCTISDDCGIHIHVDLTRFDTNDYRKVAIEWFNNHLSDVESIFPKYTGSYNKRIAKCGKGSWVNLSVHGTVEFRIAPLTFDYEVLIIWIVKCCKLVSRMIKECRLDCIRVVKSEDKRVVTDLRADQGGNYITITPNDNGSIVDGIASTDATAAMVRFIRRNPELYQSTLNSIIRDLSAGQIDCHLEGDFLVMDYPDGERRRMGLDMLFRCYLDGGIRNIIDRAVRDSTRTDWNNTLRGNGWIYNMDTLTSYYTYITDNLDTYGSY